jgi:hypothetical protein
MPENTILELKIKADEELSQEKLYKYTMDLKEALEAEVRDVSVDLKEGIAEVNTRGEPITIGLIIITLIKAGAITALASTIKTWIESRQRSIEIEFTTKDGRKVSIKSNNFSSEDIIKLL